MGGAYEPSGNSVVRTVQAALPAPPHSQRLQGIRHNRKSMTCNPSTGIRPSGEPRVFAMGRGHQSDHCTQRPSRMTKMGFGHVHVRGTRKVGVAVVVSGSCGKVGGIWSKDSVNTIQKVTVSIRQQREMQSGYTSSVVRGNKRSLSVRRINRRYNLTVDGENEGGETEM